ncbi:MAG: serine/threonine protein kinase [Myxococcales bacterium]|nr:serine/threonine protein kinase [Myxococcales bacterium]
MADDGSGVEDTRRVRVPAGLRIPDAGDVIGDRWRLDAYLDGGGMGQVWRATDLRLEEAVAVKLLNPLLATRPIVQERFLREARASAQIRGPNVVSVFDFAVDATFGVPYMAMELLRGQSLSHRLRGGPLGYLQTASLLRDVCAALGRAHALGIVHRDLKPSNLFLVSEEGGVVHKVLDFGIAKVVEEARSQGLTEPGNMLGTPNYVSPEQYEDSSTADHRADVWALAAIAYECMTGQLAFSGSTVHAILMKVCLEPSPVPSKVAEVPPGFDAWFARATAKDRDERTPTVAALLEGFLAIGAASAPRTKPRPPSEPRASHSRAWVSDANQIAIESIEDVVFKSALVREFVEGDSRYFISGAKGCGKTLLLTYKRARLAERHGDRGVTFVPEGRPYLDLMGDLPNVGKACQTLMENLGTAKRLWGLALRLSALSHHPDGGLERAALAAMPARLREVAEGRRTAPTVVLKEILQLTPSQIHKLLDETEMPLEHAVRGLHNGLMFFIDKTDQALRDVSREAWVAMQAGLVEAAWDLMNTNAHVKVFATIREEAFSTYESDIKTNLFGATTSIRYSKVELRQMLERLTAFYEGLPLRDFVTVDVVTATGGHHSEGVFDYLFRHSLGRPRDLVILASALSRNRAEMDERSFKKVVQETSAGILVSNVFDEMRTFLTVLVDRQNRARFLASLPFPVLSEDDLAEVWCTYHGMDRAYFDQHGRTAAGVFHPFRELYDCGLLGVLEEDHEDGLVRQAFKQPHQAMRLDRYELPRSRVYLLHPSLQALIVQLGQGSLRPMRELVLGHELPWPPHYALQASLQQALLRATRAPPDVEAALTDMLAALGRELAAGRPLTEVRARLGDQPGFVALCHRLDELDLDDLHLALLEAFGSELRPTVGDGHWPQG